MGTRGRGRWLVVEIALIGAALGVVVALFSSRADRRVPQAAGPTGLRDATVHDAGNAELAVAPTTFDESASDVESNDASSAASRIEPLLASRSRRVVAPVALELSSSTWSGVSGWARYDLPDSKPFGFSSRLSTLNSVGASRVDVYVPGCRCASFALPLESASVQLEPGPALDLLLSADEVARAAEAGWSYELVPIQLDDECARGFVPQMRLLPMWSGDRTRVALPSTGTYELRGVAAGGRTRAAGPASVRVYVPASGAVLDP